MMVALSLGDIQTTVLIKVQFSPQNGVLVQANVGMHNDSQTLSVVYISSKVFFRFPDA